MNGLEEKIRKIIEYAEMVTTHADQIAPRTIEREYPKFRTIADEIEKYFVLDTPI